MIMEWLPSKQIKITPPARPKKITGTRFAGILGLNPWATPFEIWCEITRTYEKPFLDTMYTKAGKIIEPKQIEYMKHDWYMSGLRTPTDLYGEDYFQKMYGDFFHENEIFGGMWDSIIVDKLENPNAVLEFKTTKRVEDWKRDIPVYYALQAALYAYLLKVNSVYMVASFLSDWDYYEPENFKPNIYNTIVRPFIVYVHFPEFYCKINFAIDWWKKHVLEGISPEFDEKRDAEILKELRRV